MPPELKQEHLDQITETNVILKGLVTRVEKHDHFINGNGDEGAKERLGKLEQRWKITQWVLSVPIVGTLFIWLKDHI